MERPCDDTTGALQPSELRRGMRLRDVERRLFALRVTRLGIAGVVVPSLAVMAWMLAPHLFDPHAWTTAHGLAGVGGVVFGGIALFQGLRRLAAEADDLEDERRRLSSREGERDPE